MLSKKKKSEVKEQALMYDNKLSTDLTSFIHKRILFIYKCNDIFYLNLILFIPHQY